MGAPSSAAPFAQRVIVGIGELGVSNNPSITLSTYALGSCVAVAAHDPLMQAGGLLHIMLPDSAIAPAKAVAHPAMFPDTGLPLLFRALANLNGDPSRIRIFLAGGAGVGCTNDAFKLGERNVRATASYLEGRGYRVHHSDVGGTLNRTIHLNVGTGEITLTSPLKNETFVLSG